VQARPDRVHNDYLNTLADWGIAGAALVASAWVLLGLGVENVALCPENAHRPWEQTRQRKNTRSYWDQGWSVAILLHSVVDFNMHIPRMRSMVTLMALLTSHLRFATERFGLLFRFGSRCLFPHAWCWGSVTWGYRDAVGPPRTLAHQGKAMPDFGPVQTELL
jgi:hypothetical protein